MQADIDQFRAYGAQLFAISIETQAQGQALKEGQNLTFPIIPDPEAQAIDRYAGREEDTGLARPATFVIDSEGRIAWAYIGQDANDRPTNESILAELDRL